MACKHTYKGKRYTETEIKDLILEQDVLKNNPIITFTKKIFKTLPYQYKEDLLNEGSRKYGIERGESKATVKYSQADQNKVDFGLKSIEILQSDKAFQIFAKGEKNKWDLNKILNELQIPKEQKQLILDLNITDREQLAVELSTQMSYTIEINTAKENHTDEGKDSLEHSDLNVPGGTNYKINVFKTPSIIPSIINHFFHKNQIGWFRSDDKTTTLLYFNEFTLGDTWYVQGDVLMYNKEIYFKLEGTNKSVEISKEEFNKAKNKFIKENPSQNDTTKTRRILEVQSDWGQKQRKSKEPDINIKYDIQQIINDLQKSGDLKIDCN